MREGIRPALWTSRRRWEEVGGISSLQATGDTLSCVIRCTDQSHDRGVQIRPRVQKWTSVPPTRRRHSGPLCSSFAATGLALRFFPRSMAPPTTHTENERLKASPILENCSFGELGDRSRSVKFLPPGRVRLGTVAAEVHLPPGGGQWIATWPRNRAAAQQPRLKSSASTRPPHSCMIWEIGGLDSCAGTTSSCPEKQRSVSRRARVACPRPGTSKRLCRW
jgi:hypothetical protein